MKLYNDLQLTADGAWKQQSCLLTTEREIGPEDHHVTLSTDVDPSDLHLWTAETPHLYTVTLSLVSSQEDQTTIHQVESCRVGFRTVDIHDGAVHVNGRPITVCGMNRHEHDPGTSAVSSQLFVCSQFPFSRTLFDSYRSW
jgi:beta-galactosidase/beta-glucuronidase